MLYPCPLVLSHFTSNKNLRSKPNKYKGRKKMLSDLIIKCSLLNKTKYQKTKTSAQSTPKRRLG